MAETLQNRLGVIEALDDLARAFLKVSDVLHDCACELSDQLAEDCTETKELTEIKPVEPVKPKKRRTLPGRTGLFDTKRMHKPVKVKFFKLSRPMEFAGFKRLGLFLTGATPEHRLFDLPIHIDTGKQYIEAVKARVDRIAQQHRPELGGVEWISRTTTSNEVLKA